MEWVGLKNIPTTRQTLNFEPLTKLNVANALKLIITAKFFWAITKNFVGEKLINQKLKQNLRRITYHNNEPKQAPYPFNKYKR